MFLELRRFRLFSGCALLRQNYHRYDLIADNTSEGAGCTVEINGREYFIVMTPFQQ